MFFRNLAPVEVGSLSHYLQGFIHSRWLLGIVFHQQYHDFRVFPVFFPCGNLRFQTPKNHRMNLSPVEAQVETPTLL